VFVAERDEGPEFPVIPTVEQINKVMNVVAEATVAKRPLLPQTIFERRANAVGQWFFAHSVHASLLMLATAFLAFYLKSRPLIDTSIALAEISNVLFFGTLGAIILGSIPFLWYVFRSPYGPFLTFVKSSAHFDLKFVQALNDCSTEAVLYVLVQYRQQRNVSERRAGMIAGAIDKVGIFPALATLVILVTNLTKAPGTVPWASIFGPLLLAFNFLSVAACEMMQKMDRVIALLEFSIQNKKKT
jgi:hypothetical protein